MRKIFILSLTLMLLVLSACNTPKQESVLENTAENVTETSTAETTETEAVSEPVQEETTPAELPWAEKLNLGEVDELNYNERDKFIYFTDYGRYYPVEIGGRASANYVLCLDRGDGEPEILTETEDSSVYYCEGNSLYLTKHLTLEHKYVRYKLENNELTAIDEFDDNNHIYKEYINEYIYYYHRDDKYYKIYRTDCNGNNHEDIISVENDKQDIQGSFIYDGKLWYEYVDRVSGEYTHILAYYDMNTGKTEEFKNVRAGIINNGFMYYKVSDKIFRFNLSSYECEIVCEAENENCIENINFYEDYLLYSVEGKHAEFASIYKKSDNENTLIFSTKEFMGDKGFYILGIQCQDDRIFVMIGSGAFYQCIIEIDIDGNLIEFIHEDRPVYYKD